MSDIVEKYFGGSGKVAGMEIWRIEKLEPVRQPKESNGNFYSGDSYICLYTKVSAANLYEWHIHFWLGKDTSQDEMGAAALMTIELDDYLGGAPIQHREVQGHESSMFLSYFKNGIKCLDGGVDSAFRHVQADKYEPRLLHLKGKRDVRVMQTELSFRAMNDGDVFILDNGLTLYQWNGKNANKYEKFKGLEMVTQIKDQERRGRPETIFLDQGVNCHSAEAEKFWKILGGDSPIKTAAEAGDDEEQKREPPQLFKVSDASGSLEVTPIATGKMERSLLDENDVFVLDTSGELFVWVGKASTKNEKKNAMEYAAQYLKTNNRPAWCPITRLVQNGETPVFKSFFGQWEAPKMVQANAPKKVAEQKSDFSALYGKNKQEEEDQVNDDGKGTLKIWRIESLATVEISRDSYGQFYGGDSYIVLYEYMIKSKEAQLLYFWQGRESSTDEKSASALLTKQIDDEMTAAGKDPVQVRVVQGKEPSHFLSLFKGKFIVHTGGIASAFRNVASADSYDTRTNKLYHVKGTTPKNTRALQVEPVAFSLNSGDCYILLTSWTEYVWCGKGSSAEERQYGQSIAEVLRGSLRVQIVEEGEEPEEFWDALGGKTDYPTSKEMQEGAREPRLFHGSNRTGAFMLEEIFNFNQDDLINEDVFLLDTFQEVYIWVGGEANATEKTEAFEAALQYVKNAPDGRSPDTPVYKIDAGKEPPMFTAHFMGWDDSKSRAAGGDPYAEKLKMLKNGGLEKITNAKEALGYADPATTKFAYADLKGKNVAKVDPSKKHEYLSDAEFKKVFKMSLQEFYQQKDWKQKQLKQSTGLF